ncbi:MAG TPA: glycosyltransferase family 4 protein [Terriglobales bacterium]|nr:glycosyltransferase family 4 protein [Terriglobales bacterium]
MTKVLLINQEQLPHYRISVYNHLAAYLKKEGYSLTVASEGLQPGSAHPVEFEHAVLPLSFFGLARLMLASRPEVVILWVRLRYLYLFPTLFFAKLLGKKVIYWGHGADLGKREHHGLPMLANSIEYEVCDALILYAEHLRKNVKPRFYPKVFIANNTLAFSSETLPAFDRAACLARYGIHTRKNIICCGRMQVRKRLDHLFAAFGQLKRRDTGLILVGPDTEGVLTHVAGENIHVLGPIYGDERLQLLAACEVFCLPGAVGLSIVDAFYCGLPLVTEDGDESPEIMYLKDGVNGFVVPRGDIAQLASRLNLLLDDDALRRRFAAAAQEEIRSHGHIDTLCAGFVEALRFVEGEPAPLSVQEKAAAK